VSPEDGAAGATNPGKRSAVGNQPEITVQGVDDELEALAAAIRATDLADIAADSWTRGETSWEWTLHLLVEAGQLARRALDGRWAWLEQRGSQGRAA
jgi:hypothetical protein